MGIVENLDPLLRHVGLRVDRQNVTPDTAAILLLAGFGAISIGSFFYKLLRILVNVYLVPGIPLSKFGASKKAPGSGSWAVVTGATDGIGKEFALQLAKAGFNVLLASRTPEKLGAVAGEIESKYPGVKTKSQAIDFALGDEKQYLALEDALKGLDVGVLVNNVGKSHDIPVTFAEVSAQEMEDIVEINIVAQLRVTKMVVNGMIERRRGLILNIGSFAGQATTPLLATYAGTKSFLAAWSQAMGEELKRSNVQVQLLNTYFVVSALSKIRKPSAMIPTPKQYVAKALSSIGNPGGAIGRPYTSTPWPLHALVDWAIAFIFPRGWLLGFTHKQQLEIRKRAIRKSQKVNKSE